MAKSKPPKHRRITALSAVDALTFSYNTGWSESHRLERLRDMLVGHIKASLVRKR